MAPAVCLVPTSALSQAGESIPVQKWNSPQGGQVPYADAAVGASNGRRRSSAV